MSGQWQDFLRRLLEPPGSCPTIGTVREEIPATTKPTKRSLP